MKRTSRIFDRVEEALVELSELYELTTFLAIHLDWLTDHPSAAEFADALDELALATRDALRPAVRYRSLSRNEN